MRSRLGALLILSGTALALAACSNSTPHAATTTTTHRATTTTTAAPTTTSSSSSTTTSTVATAGCNHMTGTPVQGQGAAGTITGFITVTNTGPSTCTTLGYPALALLGSTGAGMTVTVVDGLSVQVSTPANAAPSTVTIAPGAKAQFAYQYSDVPTGNETSCPMSASAEVTVPGATVATPAFALAVSPCDHGTMRVSPLYAPPA